MFPLDRMMKLRRAVFILAALWILSSLPSLYSSHYRSDLHSSTGTHPPCWHLDGGNDTLVILRTGATEFIDKFPIHMKTTFRCYPHYIVFSDHEEIFDGEHIRDVLKTVSPQVRQSNPDFILYSRLQTGGRGALEAHELSGNTSRPDSGSGKGDRPGWRLDKWKFLPMLNQTYHIAPEMKWYEFVETDTHLFWATMLRFQAQMDHTKRYYMGGQIYIGDVIFAHGGSGFLVSNAALKELVRYYAKHQHEIEEFTAGHWAGDCVLGKVFADAGVPLTRTWPIIQGDNPGVLPYGRWDNENVHTMWCYPITTYHHVSADSIAQLWHYEQISIAVSKDGFLRNRDVFVEFIMPQMQQPKHDWDNDCKAEQEAVDNVENCGAICTGDPTCLQYRFDAVYKRCSTSADPKLGEKMRNSNYTSGWMYDRIEQWKDQRPVCGPAPWIT